VGVNRKKSALPLLGGNDVRGEMMSETISGALDGPEGVFQCELPNGLPQPWLRTLRPAFFIASPIRENLHHAQFFGTAESGSSRGSAHDKSPRQPPLAALCP
jgi:hypothetical protein